MRVYEQQEYYESQDITLIQDVKHLKELKKLSNEIESAKLIYENYYKIICQRVRDSYEIENLLSLSLSNDENTVAIFLFDRKASDESYDIQRDESGKVYIEIKE